MHGTIARPEAERDSAAAQNDAVRFSKGYPNDFQIPFCSVVQSFFCAIFLTFDGSLSSTHRTNSRPHDIDMDGLPRPSKTAIWFFKCMDKGQWAARKRARKLPVRTRWGIGPRSLFILFQHLRAQVGSFLMPFQRKMRPVDRIIFKGHTLHCKCLKWRQPLPTPRTFVYSDCHVQTLSQKLIFARFDWSRRRYFDKTWLNLGNCLFSRRKMSVYPRGVKHNRESSDAGLYTAQRVRCRQAVYAGVQCWSVSWTTR